jgi:hypothetical protein
MRYKEVEICDEGYWGDYTEYRVSGSLPVPRSPTPPPPPETLPQPSKRGGFGRKLTTNMKKKALRKSLKRHAGTHFLVVLRRVVS